jgi:hypothetical protein
MSDDLILPPDRIQRTPTNVTPVEEGVHSDISVNVQKTLGLMLSKELHRANKFDGLIDQIEEVLFSEPMIQEALLDPLELKKLYTMCIHRKSDAQRFSFKLLELISKNAMLSKWMAGVFATQSGENKAMTDKEIEYSEQMKEATRALREIGMQLHRKIEGTGVGKVSEDEPES